MDVSMFKKLSLSHPEAVVTLNMQYRMNEPIMSLSNELIYDAHMKCGCPEVASSNLHLPKYEEMLLDTQCDKSEYEFDFF